MTARLTTARMHELLSTVPATAATEFAVQAWPGLDLWPAATLPAALDLAGQISDWATSHHIKSLSQLTGPAATRMVCELTGTEHLTRFATREHTEAAHRIRGVLAAVRGTALLVLRASNPALTFTAPTDSLIADLPALPPRCGRPRRPLADDEIACCRIVVELDTTPDTDWLPHAAYALAETGLALAETTQIRISDVKGADHPSGVDAPGRHGATARTCDLDTWPAKILAEAARGAMAQGLGEQARLAYGGAHTPGGQDASASLSGILNRIMGHAGVRGRGVKATSIALWRADYELRTSGDPLAAAAVLGVSVGAMLKALGYTLDERLLYAGKLEIRDYTGQLITTVSTRRTTA